MDSSIQVALCTGYRNALLDYFQADAELLRRSIRVPSSRQSSTIVNYSPTAAIHIMNCDVSISYCMAFLEVCSKKINYVTLNGATCKTVRPANRASRKEQWGKSITSRYVWLVGKSGVGSHYFVSHCLPTMAPPCCQGPASSVTRINTLQSLPPISVSLIHEIPCWLQIINTITSAWLACNSLIKLIWLACNIK